MQFVSFDFLTDGVLLTNICSEFLKLKFMHFVLTFSIYFVLNFFQTSYSQYILLEGYESMYEKCGFIWLFCIISLKIRNM